MMNARAIAGGPAAGSTILRGRLRPLGLLARQESTTDRRQVQLTLTDHGRDVLGSVLRHRQTAPATRAAAHATRHPPSMTESRTCVRYRCRARPRGGVAQTMSILTGRYQFLYQPNRQS